jgi:hypothetical protein
LSGCLVPFLFKKKMIEVVIVVVGFQKADERLSHG